MDRLRVQVQARGRRPASLRGLALPPPPGLADVVRGHVAGRERAVAVPPRPGAAAGRSGGPLPHGRRPVPARAAAVHPGRALPLPVRAPRGGRPRLVAPDAAGLLPAAAGPGQPGARGNPGRARLAGLKKGLDNPSIVPYISDYETDVAAPPHGRPVRPPPTRRGAQ